MFKKIISCPITTSMVPCRLFSQQNKFPQIVPKTNHSVWLTLLYLFSIAMSVFKCLICQTKVSHLANRVLIDKNILSCEVVMDYLQKET